MLQIRDLRKYPQNVDDLFEGTIFEFESKIYIVVKVSCDEDDLPENVFCVNTKKLATVKDVYVAVLNNVTLTIDNNIR